MNIHTNYTGMLQQCVRHGKPKANTRSLGQAFFSFGIPEEYAGLLVFPKKRMGLTTYTSYALAEAAWYMSRDRKVDWISNYGPIWKNMVDNDRLVNSNYGYQLCKNNDLTRKLKLYEPVYYNIINYENSKSTTDVPCNNVVVAELKDDGLHMYSLARSIDLIYGLPFDMIALQAFGYILLQQQNVDSYVSQVTFEMIDAHVYNNMIPKLDMMYTSNVFTGIRFKDTDYYIHDPDYQVVNYREYAKEIVKYDVMISENEDLCALDYFKVREHDYLPQNSYEHNNLWFNPYNRKDIKVVNDKMIYYNTEGKTLKYWRE